MKTQKILPSFGYALAGINYALKNQQNFRLMWLASILIFLFNSIYNFLLIEQIIFVILNFLVLSLELLNSSLENLADSTGREFNLFKKHAKNLAASSVLLISVSSVIILLLIINNNFDLILLNMQKNLITWVLFLVFMIINFGVIYTKNYNLILSFSSLITLFLILLFAEINFLFFIITCAAALLLNLTKFNLDETK